MAILPFAQCLFDFSIRLKSVVIPISQKSILWGNQTSKYFFQLEGSRGAGFL